MTNRKKAILLIIILAAVFAAAFFGYRALSGYVQENSGTTQADRDMNGDASGSTESDQAENTGESGENGTLSDAPDFVMVNTEGEQVWLSDYFGKPLVINFWASWCPPCKEEMPYFEAAYQKYGDQVTFLMVNLTDGSRETVETAESFIKESGYTFPVYYDTEGRGVASYGVMSIPVTVCVNADGEIYAQQIGTIPEEKLDEWMRSLASESAASDDM